MTIYTSYYLNHLPHINPIYFSHQIQNQTQNSITHLINPNPNRNSNNIWTQTTKPWEFGSLKKKRELAKYVDFVTANPYAIQIIGLANPIPWGCAVLGTSLNKMMKRECTLLGGKKKIDEMRKWFLQFFQWLSSMFHPTTNREINHPTNTTSPPPPSCCERLAIPLFFLHSISALKPSDRLGDLGFFETRWF